MRMPFLATVQRFSEVVCSLKVENAFQIVGKNPPLGRHPKFAYLCKKKDMATSRYEQRGVSATKDEVHAALDGMDKGLYPNAFCKVLPDVAGGDEQYCTLMHADTAGTKTSLAYLYWKETGDLSVWRGIAQDAIVMNLDDMGCVGCVDQIILSSTIGRNKRLVSGEVVRELIQATRAFAEEMAAHGIHIHLAGGETADVGDIVRTVDVGYTAFARMRRDQVIVNDIQPGDAVVGLASFGKATYESEYNSGMGSNGLTSARHDVLNKLYGEKYPESYDTAMPGAVAYSGSKSLTDVISVGGLDLPLGKFLLSPTRTYLPVISELLNQLRPELHGIIHCTGGGQTKVSKYLHGARVIKENLFETPELFALIQKESGTGWREMYQVFNMGHRLEVYLPPARAAEVIGIAGSFGIEAQIIGYVEDAESAGVELRTPHGTFTYE